MLFFSLNLKLSFKIDTVSAESVSKTHHSW